MSPKSGSDGEYIHPQQHESNDERRKIRKNDSTRASESACMQILVVIPNGVRNLSEVWNGETKRDSSARSAPRNDRTCILLQNFSFLSFYSMNEQRARFAKRAKLRGVFEPAARVGFRRGRGIGNGAMRDIRKTRILK